MEESYINKLYDAESFRKTGHELIDLLSDYLTNQYNDNDAVNNFQNPQELLDSWEDFLSKDHSLISYFKKILADSIHLHNPNYMGHQVSVPSPFAALGGLMSDLLSNGMAVYEMGMTSNILERKTIEIINNKIGYDEQSGGFLTSGGTLANLTALLTARAAKVKEDVWAEGTQQKYAVMVSDQAHYCIDRAVRIMGLGELGVVKIPVDNNFKMDASLLEQKYDEATENGLDVFAIIGSSCSTSTGSYDDLELIGKFAKVKDLWFHVDGAHGAAVIMSEKYKHLVSGISNADSVIIDCHKMMMTPALTTAVLYKNKLDSNKTFRQKAEYLFEDTETFDWYNSGKRTFECTKLMMSIKFMAIIQQGGVESLGQHVDLLYDNALKFAKIIRDDELFELATFPQANILCFRIFEAKSDLKSQNSINAQIREGLLKDGDFYIVQTVINEIVFLRITVMNPYTTTEHFNALIKTIKSIHRSIS